MKAQRSGMKHFNNLHKIQQLLPMGQKTQSILFIEQDD
jgi:hypothetical protein